VLILSEARAPLWQCIRWLGTSSFTSVHVQERQSLPEKEREREVPQVTLTGQTMDPRAFGPDCPGLTWGRCQRPSPQVHNRKWGRGSDPRGLSAVSNERGRGAGGQ
jgi:hypothetical protein